MSSPGDKDTGDDVDTKPVDTAALTKFVQNAGQVGTSKDKKHLFIKIDQ